MQLVCGLALMLFLMLRFLNPAVIYSKDIVNDGNFLSIFKRLLVLAVPATCVWLCMFYTLFHSWLNLLAEATRFGDRVFYKVCSDIGDRYMSSN